MSNSTPVVDVTPAGQRKQHWRNVTAVFPFVFIPLAALIATLAAGILPWLTGASDY